PDLPGHGKTSGRPLDSIEEMAGWALQLVDRLGFDQVVPIGHSMGSLVAMEITASSPDRVPRLGLIATTDRMLVHPDLQAAADRLDPLAADLIVGWTHSGRSRFGHHDSAGIWMPAVNRRLLERNASALGVDLVACARWSGSEAFIVTRKPTVVVAGSHDRMIPSRSSLKVAEKVGADVIEVERGSHASLYDHPREVVDPLIDWLRRDESD
ncbi:MAG: alpha/beta hydrolase, partial [Acidimicrobiia bacterium]|nr:alpha/beta hydrolase [Acidimicrobiia bacterium]